MGMDNKERAELYSENSQYWHGEYQKLSAESSERIAELESALEKIKLKSHDLGLCGIYRIAKQALKGVE